MLLTARSGSTRRQNKGDNQIIIFDKLIESRHSIRIRNATRFVERVVAFPKFALASPTSRNPLAPFYHSMISPCVPQDKLPQQFASPETHALAYSPPSWNMAAPALPPNLLPLSLTLLPHANAHLRWLRRIQDCRPHKRQNLP